MFIDAIYYFKQATTWLVKEEVKQIATLIRIDLGNELEVISHLTDDRYVVSFKSPNSKTALTMPPLINLPQESSIFEMELHALFAITFQYGSDLLTLLLSDGWPSDIYPMQVECISEALKQRLEEP